METRFFKNTLAVKGFPRPGTSKNVKQFLGLAGYYRRFITNFSKIAKYLTNLLKNDEKFISQKRNEAQDRAFRELRDLSCSELLLQYSDFTKPILTTDVSAYVIGSTLDQETIGKIYPLHILPGCLITSNRIIPSWKKNYSR